MKKLFKSLILTSTLILGMTSSVQAITCVLTGQVFGRDSKTLILVRATEDPNRATQIFIPINNGKFEYSLTVPYTEAYFLFFQDELEMGSFNPICFFAENDTIVFRLHFKGEDKQDEISGGELTSAYYNYLKFSQELLRPQGNAISDSIAELKKKDAYYSAEFKLQQEKQRIANEKSNAENSTENDFEISIAQTKVLQGMINRGEYVSPKGKTLNDKMDSILVLKNQHKLNYIKNNLSLVSYYFLFRVTEYLNDYKGIAITDIKPIALEFAEKYPGHPYTQLMAVMVDGLLQTKVGGRYYDFSANDLNGENHTLSEIIDGKYAVIDLWATWCGPCIMGSKNLLPIYEEFKDKGFTICGVAREYKNTDDLICRIEKEKFPWINLVELDDKNQIWLHYGVQGGRKFLVDNTGVILAIEPDAEEIRKILNEKLK